jgi:hypothetical protein
MSEERYDGWVPFRLYWPGGPEPMVEWCYLGSTAFTDPFLVSTFQNALETPFGTLFRRHTPMSELRRWSEASPGIPPTGFIFHASRCGSTLITQLLAQLPRNLVLSEPEPVDAVVLSQFRAPLATDEHRIEWLRNMVSALGQRRAGGERNLFVKFEPRDIFALPLVRQAFPEVPWLFLYRDPVETLVSNLRSPPASLMRVIPQANVDLRGVGDTEEYLAAMLGAILERAVAAFPDPRIMLVNYRQLPDEIWGSIAGHFGISFTAAEIAQLHEAACFDAKRPGQRFTSDSEGKVREASGRARSLTQRWMQQHFASLEALRVS